MLNVKTNELKSVLDRELAEKGTLVFLGGAGSGKTTVAQDIVSILSESRTVGFVTDEDIESTLTHIDDAIGQAKPGHVWVVDLPLDESKLGELEAKESRVVWLAGRNRLYGDEAVDVAQSATSGDGVYNVEYFVSK